MGAFIVDVLRTPRGRGNAKGTLRALTPVALLAQLARALQEKHALDTTAIADAIIGCVGQVGPQGANVARAALLEAGYPDSVPAMTVNRFCTSSLSATQQAALRAEADDALCLAGGVEMLSLVPLAADQGPLTHDPALQERQAVLPIGICADVIATREGISRDECDAYALESQRRAVLAREGGAFRSLVAVRGEGGAVLLGADETPRPETTAASLAAMPAVFAQVGETGGFDAWACRALGLKKVEHFHTAGNAPASADGASVVLVGSEAAVRRQKLVPRARILAQVELGAHHVLALDGTLAATRRAVERAGIPLDAVDHIEVNESFAAPTIQYLRALGLDARRVNPFGGAIALGHPMGATGGVLLATVLDGLEASGGRYGLVAIAGATGLASAVVVERLERARWG